MSAFVVTDETVNCVCVAMRPDDFGYVPCEQMDDIGKRLLAMNYQAVNERYQTADESPGDFRFRPCFTYSKIQQFKAVTCLIYQCSEGNVPEMALYAELEAVQKRLAHEIIETLPEYNAAQWDMKPRTVATI